MDVFPSLNICTYSYKTETEIVCMGKTSEIKMRWLATFKSKRYANPLSLLLHAKPFPNPQFRLFRGNKKGNYSLQRGLSRRKCVDFNTKTPLTYIFIVACVFLERIYYKRLFSEMLRASQQNLFSCRRRRKVCLWVRQK